MLLNYKDTIQIYSLVQRQLNTGSLQRSRGKAALWFLVDTRKGTHGSDEKGEGRRVGETY